MREQARSLALELTLEEKLLLIKGMGTWHTYPIERLDLPSIMMADGPHGLRKQDQGGENPMGLGKSVQTVCFPTAGGTGASFDRDLLRRLGEVLGQECRAQELAVLLGPGVNIKRSPLCGRNFEYFSEDPYLSAEMAVNYTQGLQSKGVGVSIKHFAANNQEKRRMTVQSVVDERAMREIYLPSFEQTVKRADPWTVMCAYNRLFDGIYCSENKRLLTDILRDEWGFDGVVVSDWGAVSNRAAGVEAGLDLEMPDSYGLHNDKLQAALASGALSEEALNEACARLIDLILKAVEATDSDEPVPPQDNEADHAIAREMARNTMVLLQNDGILPLDKKQNDIAFIGGFAKLPRIQGGGSSHVHAYKITSAYETAKKEGLNFEYAEGFSVTDYNYDVVKARAAVELAQNSETVVIFAGLPEAMDSEGADRKHLDLPPCQNELISEIAAVQNNVIVVLCNGSAVRMPWADDVRAILESYLAGEAVGEAQIDLLYGAYSPNAKLAETFPLKLQDTPCYGNFPGGTATVEYRESIYVGYRYYDKANKDVLFPFGHGLSYTTFVYSDLKVSRKNLTPDTQVKVSVDVTNTGSFDAAEVVQFYVSAPDDGVYRAEKELKGFAKVFLKAGEKKRVSAMLDSRAFAYFHVGLNDWYCAPGAYEIHAAASSRDVRLSASVTMKNEQEAPAPYQALPSYAQAMVHSIPDDEFEAVLGYAIPPANLPVPRRLDWDATIEDAQQSPFGRLLSKIIVAAFPVVSKMVGAEEAIGEMSGLVETVMEMPVRTIAQWSAGMFDGKMLDALVSIFNEEEYLKSFYELACGGCRAIKKVVCKK